MMKDLKFKKMIFSIKKTFKKEACNVVGDKTGYVVKKACIEIPIIIRLEKNNFFSKV